MAEYIEREAAVTVCDKQYKECLRKSDFCGDTVAWNICADIKAIPAADVAPVVHARWIPTEYPFMNECEDCSNCGYRTVYGNDYPYCPNCGAKMME